MKKIFIFISSLLFCLFMVSCSDKKETVVNVKNPFVEVDTIEEAKEISGFSITLPDNLFDNEYERKIRVIKDKLIEVNYRGLEQWIIIRKSLYDGDDDISGDYNQYPEERIEIHGNIRVVIRGNEEKINVVSWRVGDYAYSLNINPGGLGINEDMVYEIMWQID